MPRPLTISLLQSEAAKFAQIHSGRPNAELFGMDNGKTVGTHLEREFQKHLLLEDFVFQPGNAAEGIDFPDLKVDIKTTRSDKPQSSCPFRSARQKIYGLGYSLLIFAYDKSSDESSRTTRLDIRHTIFADKNCTGDFQMTKDLRKMLEERAEEDDIVSYLQEKLVVDDDLAEELAAEVLKNPPPQGYLSMCSVPQWRLRYVRIIKNSGIVEGLIRLTLP